VAEFHIEVVDIPHSEIEPNPDNPNEMDSKTLDALKEDIEKRGFVQPVLVRPIGEIAGEVPMHVATCPMTKPKPADRYTCICQHFEADEKVHPEGGRRYRIVDGVIEAESNEVDANIRMVTMNRLRGHFVPIKLAHLLADLATRVDRKEMEKRLGMDASDMKNLLDLGDYTEPPAPKVDTDPPERPEGTEIVVVATPAQATEIFKALGTHDEEEQARRIEEAVDAD
jgi:hypothetical protein